MNIVQNLQGQRRRMLAGIPAIALAAALLGGSPAASARPVPDDRVDAGAHASFDIAEFVLKAKVRMAEECTRHAHKSPGTSPMLRSG